MKRAFRYNLVDVFTHTPFEGNPLAVFTRAAGLNEQNMQAIAREMNLSETVFFFPPEQGGHARIRIFTPQIELPFAGHPVLGSAWVLGHPMEMGGLRLETGVGTIEVELFREGGQLFRARMTQPLPMASGETLNIEQGRTMLRPSTLLAEATLVDRKLTCVTVAGGAVIVARGELLL